MFHLRPYQAEAKQAILNEWDEGHRKTLLVLPTGCGKTVVFASVTEYQVNKGHRVLIMAHRGELLAQAADKLKEAAGIDSCLEKADSTSLGSMLSVTVGSVQSLAQEKRLSRFPSDYFQDIVVDEAHHCTSDSYLRVLNHFPRANILGVTATPDRGDMKSLGDFFDSKAYEYSMTDAIKEGYLCPIKAQLIPLNLDISNVGISSGDFAAGEVGCALEPYLMQIAKEMLRYCKDRKTVVFLPLIATSQKFCQILNDVGLKAAEVNGNSDDRAEVIQDFENGKYDVLCNSMLLTEGWDCPSVDCIVVLRPTKVRSLYQQMVGRGMRLAAGKKNLLLLDFLWMTQRHDLCKPSSLISKDEGIAKKIDNQMQENEDGIDLIESEEQAERDVLAEREESLARQLAEMRGRKRKLVDPIQYALSIAAEDLANYEPTFAWEMASPTEKQLQFLERRGIFPDSVSNAGMASLLIDKLKRRQEAGLATPKQIRCLERYGFRQVGTWQFSDASSLISELADNHWRLPSGIIPAIYKPYGGK
jgi:superfamily II DNA or RNA helicase